MRYCGHVLRANGDFLEKHIIVGLCGENVVKVTTKQMDTGRQFVVNSGERLAMLFWLLMLRFYLRKIIETMLK